MDDRLDEILKLLREIRDEQRGYQDDPLPSPPWDNPLQKSTKCSKCGMTFTGVTGYVCANSGCPMGLGPITCGVS